MRVYRMRLVAMLDSDVVILLVCVLEVTTYQYHRVVSYRAFFLSLRYSSDESPRALGVLDVDECKKQFNRKHTRRRTLSRRRSATALLVSVSGTWAKS